MQFQFEYKQDAIEWLEDDKDDKWVISELIVPKAEAAVKYHLDRIIAFILEKTKCNDYVVFLTSDDQNNFRYSVANILPYKGNRDTDHRPYYWDKVRHLITWEHNGVICEDCEADDGMSKAAYACEHDYCIVSQDKDLNMVPGDHFNLPKNKLWKVSKDEGIKFFYTQLLVGDMTDNIYGIYRIGMTTATKMIDSLKTTDERVLWNYCLDAYDAALNDPKKRKKMPVPDMPLRERVLEIARLLWMQSYDGELWLPPDEREAA